MKKQTITLNYQGQAQYRLSFGATYLLACDEPSNAHTFYTLLRKDYDHLVWRVRHDEVKRLGFLPLSVESQIRKALKRDPKKQWTEAKLKKYFFLSDARYNRRVSQCGNEAWAASCAIGIAHSKDIFYFPFLPSKLLYHWYPYLEPIIDSLKALEKIIILPTPYKEIFTDLCDEIIFLDSQPIPATPQPAPQPAKIVNTDKTIDATWRQLNAQTQALFGANFQWVSIPAGAVNIIDASFFSSVTLSGIEHGKGTIGGLYMVAPFLMAKYPITVGQYQQYLATNQTPKPSSNSDRDTVQTGLTWYEAQAFCKWLGEELHATVTLPTEQQWQHAATWNLQFSSSSLMGIDGMMDGYGEYCLNDWETGRIDLPDNVRFCSIRCLQPQPINRITMRLNNRHFTDADDPNENLTFRPVLWLSSGLDEG